ncbi:hypothetical protein M770_34260 (plasmid) [Pseudomonas aeruginosa VRFPA03]|nr:hypothetical protein M770_34260 [Pseudomonas aeruginosa VRFPA03]
MSPPPAAPLRIALVGDHDPHITAHRAIPLALRLAGEALGLEIAFDWLASDRLPAEPALERYDGFWGGLEDAVAEQVRQVAALRQAGEQRARDAAQAVDRGRQQAAEQYAEAQRLVRERTAGGQCAAAEAVIDQELGL